ncbi:terminase large subunit [Cellulophaga phage phi39:1]|uniref:terminase large subunit n=1 Tax=Cellulophaga phage phi39:1 TaxID=1327993 RepID=UPI000351BEE4|nr:terminase large subunit [Cellulophaga phage phi39:1]AGO49120.1 phage terminase large subunit [Cellulophaga phage phi39:1]
MLQPEVLNSIPYKYALDVREGNIVVGRKIKLAIDRFFKLIEDAEKKGYWLDYKKGFAIIKFFEKILLHTKGSKHAGKPFLLSPFQQFTLFNLFGWQTKNEDGDTIRLIRNVYEKVAKKNGKTAVMAGVLLFCLSFDYEKGAEAYVGATKEAQAKLCFLQAVEFINEIPALRAIGFKAEASQIIFKSKSTFARALGGDSKTQDGINSHLSILDEYHAHRDDSVKENLESSSASRKQPITYTITTAGTNVHGVCKSFEDSCVQILEGVNVDDTFLIMIHDLDDGDDWEDPENWIKANPNLGTTVYVSHLEKEYIKAKNQQSKIPNFKTKHLNLWVDAPNEWIPSAAVSKCQIELVPENFTKYGNCGGLDLSSTTDLTAFAIVSEPDEEGFRDAKVWCFCPLETIEKRSKEDGVPYKYWANLKRDDAEDDNDTFLIATPGNMVDYNEVAKVVGKQYFKNKCSWVEYDRKFAAGLVNIFEEENIEMSPFTQTIMNYTSPTKELERLILSKKIRLGNNPIIKYALSGCVAYEDMNENIRLDKAKATKRIDPIIAVIMALAGTLSEKEDNESSYNDMNLDDYDDVEDY